ncbi:MAG: hypothetical protein RL528_1881 [Bacteroidota bacterium]
MKTTDYIVYIIDRFPKGFVFTYADFNREVSQKQALIKALNRMVLSGKIAKLSKGKYYKPETTPFGDLLPNQKQVVKDLMEEKGKINGYLTGYSIYNQLGLTTQVSNTIQIGKNEIRPSFKRDRYTIDFIKQKNNITKDNVPLLQILDAIRYVKKIPDTNTTNSCIRFIEILRQLKEKDFLLIIRLAIKYPPATRALLGAILDELKSTKTETLYNSLNPITKYKLAGAFSVLSAAEKWNIV